MARRIETAAFRAGMDAAAAGLVAAAFRAAMQPRRLRLPDEHDPDYLHPGRTILILIEDLGIADPVLAAAGAFVETRRPELRLDAVPPDLEHAGPVREILRAIPDPGRADDSLAEALVTCTTDVRLVALAERLDHARHVHLRDPAGWAEFHRTTCSIYRPVAERTHPTLARRFRWWCSTFQRRFLARPGRAPAR